MKKRKKKNTMQSSYNKSNMPHLKLAGILSNTIGGREGEERGIYIYVSLMSILIKMHKSNDVICISMNSPMKNKTAHFLSTFRALGTLLGLRYIKALMLVLSM